MRSMLYYVGLVGRCVQTAIFIDENLDVRIEKCIFAVRNGIEKCIFSAIFGLKSVLLLIKMLI